MLNSKIQTFFQIVREATTFRTMNMSPSMSSVKSMINARSTLKRGYTTRNIGYATFFLRFRNQLHSLFKATAAMFFLLLSLLYLPDMMSAFALPGGAAVAAGSSSNNTSNNKIIIVGGGLGGLSLSLGLADLGFQVEIVEKQPNFSRTGATFGVAPNGQKALEELCPGIVNNLKLVGLSQDPPDIGIMLGWWNVRDALLDRVLKRKNAICVRNGWLLQETKYDDTCVKAVFHKQQEDADEDREELVLEGCILVGADGVNSAVRSLLGLARAKHTGVVTWRGRVVVPPLEQLDAAATADNDETRRMEQKAKIASLRPFVENPLKRPMIRLRGPMIYMSFNFNEKLPGTMALVVNIQGDDGEHTAKGTSPQAIMEEFAESDEERKEIRAILEFTDKDGLHNPTPIKVVEPPKEVGAGWGGKGRTTILGDAAHGKFSFQLGSLCCLLSQV
jgi:2-polyprenyl-6-methoxyphenol hydroxylase-like FAD-dependent oxidoreductase